MKLLPYLLLPSTARRVKKANLTYLSEEKLASLARCIDYVNGNGVNGDVIECGVALGGSGILLASRMKKRRYTGYDNFNMIPPPTMADGEDAHRRYEVITSGKSSGIGGKTYYGYRDNLLYETKENFVHFGLPVDGERVCLVQGLFQHTLLDLTTPVALAHIDCDWHNSVRYCLEKIGDIVSLGGLIVVDDYNDWEGCKRAVHSWLETSPFCVKRTFPHAILERVRV